VAVQIERQAQPNRWEDWRFRVADVVLDQGQFGTAARLLRDDGHSASFPACRSRCTATRPRATT
jgi:hypothetical protein